MPNLGGWVVGNGVTPDGRGILRRGMTGDRGSGPRLANLWQFSGNRLANPVPDSAAECWDEMR